MSTVTTAVADTSINRMGKKKINCKDYYALVTGGSSGMGLIYVKKLAQMGYNVIIAALPGTVEGVAKELSTGFPELDIVPVGINLGAENSAEQLLDAVYAHNPEAKIDVLINNAGVINVSHFRAKKLGQVQLDIMLHNLTTSKLCHLILPQMIQRDHGYILNISSLAAWLPFPFISTYCATKAYNRMLTRALRTEQYKSNINIATIYFGAVDTPLFKLSPGKRKLARCLGVMITPEKAVSKALWMLFHGRSGWMPGLVNKIAYVVCPLLPRCLISWIDRTVSKHMGIE